jgi:VWFA-related protein
MQTKDTPVPLTFKSRVNLVPVTVVVRDRKGRAAGNLTKQDYRLFANGKLQVVSQFSLEKPGVPVVITEEKPGVPAKPAGEPDRPSPLIGARFVAYLFNDAQLRFADMSYVRDAASRMLATSLQPVNRGPAPFGDAGTTQHRSRVAGFLPEIFRPL